MDEKQVTKEAIVAPQPPAPTPEEMRQKFADFQQQEWNNAANAERARMAKARGLFAKLKKPADDATPEEKELYQKQYDAIIASVVLEGDTIRYAKDKEGHHRMASDRNGFMAMPKQRGRRKLHMTKHAQGLKSAALQIFKGLFRQRMATVEAATTAKGETFQGIPSSDLTKMAAKASVIAGKRMRENHKARRRRLRNESKLQRRINAGVLPGNTNRRAYTIN